jgi:aryl-alcohol dehydrogenase-like predicted oxidoreductase
VLLYSPLAGGLLTGKYRQGQTGRLTARGIGTDSPQRLVLVDAVLEIAEATGTGAVQVSLAWLRRRGQLAHASLIPIVGPRTPAHLEVYLSALDLELSDEHLRRLDEVSAVALGTPHEDVAGALAQGIDGDRSSLTEPWVAVV